jgi:hypothetical protein
MMGKGVPAPDTETCVTPQPKMSNKFIRTNVNLWPGTGAA